jgi:predicted negative regulator of RcsB-dependent stress response
LIFYGDSSRAAPARLCAHSHLFIVAYPLATLDAHLANLGADSAQAPVKLRTPQHEIRARLANLRAAKKQSDMGRFDMSAAHL